MSLLYTSRAIFTPGTTDRASLINDAFSLAESGHLGYSIPLSMTRYLKKEKDLVPWRSAVDKIDYIEKMLVNSNQYSTLRKVTISLLVSIGLFATD